MSEVRRCANNRSIIGWMGVFV